VREYVDKVFAAAAFFPYGATEKELVGRIVMNLNPCVGPYRVFGPTSHPEGVNFGSGPDRGKVFYNAGASENSARIGAPQRE